jgi:hypothetical protein
LDDNPSRLPEVGLSDSKELAILMATSRPLQGEYGAGTISTIVRTDEPLRTFALGRFTNNVFDVQEDLPSWFLTAEGASKRDALLATLIKVTKPTTEPNGVVGKIMGKIVNLMPSDENGNWTAINNYQKQAEQAAKEGDYANHLRLFHLACDKAVALMQENGDKRQYDAILVDVLNQ